MLSRLVSASLAAPAAECLFFFDEATTTLLAAAERGYDPLLAEIERVFTAATGAKRATVLLRTGESWESPEDLRRADVHARANMTVSDEVLRDGACVAIASGLFAPVRRNEVAVLVEGAPLRADALEVATPLARIAEMALTLCEKSEEAARALDEIDVLQHLSARIMKSHDLEEILLRITHEAKRLLAADICGIMLRENDEIVMRRCVGNHAPETAALRMRPGQGVAGRVFATLEPCRVEDYLASCDAISTDFFHLARAEKVRSAIAAPVLSQGEIRGVLEVWRRRPSIFTVQDSQRLAALANLTSIAIENARLYNTLQSTVDDLERANVLLATRCASIHTSNTFQHDLMRLLLEERSLASLAARATEHARCGVIILDTRLGVEAASAVPAESLPGHRAAIAALVTRESSVVTDTVTGTSGDKTLLVQAIAAGAERFGWVAFVLGARPDESSDLAIRQVAIAVALYFAEQRAGSLARAETLEALTWDVLEGKDEVRRAALSRAREMRVDLDQPLRVAFCDVPGVGDVGAGTLADLELRRRRMRDLCLQPTISGGKLLASSTRGDRLALIYSGLAVAEAERVGQRLLVRMAQEMPGVTISIGMSGICPAPFDLPNAAREARISLDVAARRHPVRVAVYEQIGIVGLLLSLREDSDLSRVADTSLGGVFALAPSLRDPLLETLRTFFDTNCSQQATARCLGVHPKTVSYRLGKLTELTGLDLSNHEDRLLADIALRLRDLTCPVKPEGRERP